MKNIKVIIVNISLIFLFALMVHLLVNAAKELDSICYWLNHHKEMLAQKIENPDSVGNSIEELQRWVSSGTQHITTASVWVAIYSISIAACVFVFIYCNPRLFRRSTWTNLSEEWAQAKSERLARKQEKAEADKQKRLEKLQAEIEELKKE